MATTLTIIDTTLDSLAITSTLGSTVATSSTVSVPYMGGSYRYMLVFHNVSASDGVTVGMVAGVNPPALKVGQGIPTPVLLTVGAWIAVPLSASKYMQADGTILATIDATFNSAIRVTALRMPRGA